MHVLFDTSVYITALRRGGETFLRTKEPRASISLWLSAVVLEELYAGATARDRHAVERLERDFDRASRVLLPNLSDWTQAGKMLSAIASKYGYEKIGRGRLTNDALIAASAGRTGVTVITSNKRDFEKLAEFGAFPWHLSSTLLP